MTIDLSGIKPTKQGIVRRKEAVAHVKLYKKEDMNNLEFVENSTDPAYRKRSFVYDFLSSMRQKINDPMGKRNKK